MDVDADIERETKRTRLYVAIRAALFGYPWTLVRCIQESRRTK